MEGEGGLRKMGAKIEGGKVSWESWGREIRRWVWLEDGFSLVGKDLGEDRGRVGD